MRLIAFLFSLSLLLLPIAAKAEPYKLQPGDAVEIWVAQDQRMNREAVISPDGMLSLPLVGQVQAQDLTVDQLESELSGKLAGFFKGDLNLSVMLQPGPQHMPMVYVVGEVNEPGSYPYRPTMTVLHAITVAGGLYRTPMEARDRDRAVVVQGQIDQSQREISELTVRIARINAELAGHDTVELQASALPDMTDAERANFVDREQRVLNTHQSEANTQRDTQTQIQGLGDNGISAVRRQIESVKSRVNLARQRLANTTTLVNKGLAHVSAKLELEAEVAELEEQGDQFQSDLTALEAAAITEKSRVDSFFSQRDAALLTELHDSERQLEVAKASLADNERVMSIYVNTEISERRGVSAAYTVLRTEDGQVHEDPADEMTLLRPGDLVRVVYTDGPQRSAAVGDQPATARN